jgi:hypothetical protein
MTQQEFLDAVKHQQSLTRKIMANRRRRSECIQEAARERYKHLIGKFFIRDTELKGTTGADLYYVYGISADSSYANSDEVVLCVECRGLYKNYYGKPQKTAGIGYSYYCFRFAVDTDLDARFAQMWVSEDRASGIINEYCNDFCKSFVSKK